MSTNIVDYLEKYWVDKPGKVPKSEKITYVHRGSGLPQAYEFDLNTQEETLLADVDGRVLSVSHSKNGTYSILGVDYNGNEKKQLMLVSEEGSKVEKLVYSPSHFHDFGGFSPDEKHIMYGSNRGSEGTFDIYIMDLKTKSNRLIMQHEGFSTPVRWLHDGEHVVIKIKNTNIDSSYYIVNVHTGDKVKIGSVMKLARYESIIFSKERNGGFIVSDLDSDYLQLYQFSFDEPNKLTRLVDSIPWDIEQIKLSPSGEKLSLSVNEGGTSSLYLYDMETGNITKINNVPDGVKLSMIWLDEDSLLFHLKNHEVAGDLFVYDFTNNQTDRLTEVSDRIAPSVKAFKPEWCSVESFDGVEVPYFYYAKDANPESAILFLHGGPENLSRDEFNPILQYLVSQGHAVVVPNIRGSKGYGRTYLSLDDQRNRLDAVKDIACIAEEIVRKKGIHSEKIGIMGRSYGGFMVNAAITHYPELWAAGLSVVGMSHVGNFLEYTGSWRRRVREYEYGFLDRDRDFFDAISPLNLLDKVKAPLLLFHGRNDTRVPVGESEQMMKGLKNLGKEVSLEVSENEGHQMGHHATSQMDVYIPMQKKTAEFFNTHLQ